MARTQQQRVVEWRKEWRRNGAGVMAVTFAVGGTWVSASQTFVASKNDQIVHPSPYGWLLYLCIAGFVLGFYAWLSTYLDRLPMFGKKRAFSFRMGDAIMEIQSQADPHRVVQVQMVRDDPIPLEAPNGYVLAQVRQVLAKYAENHTQEFGAYEISQAFRVVDRTETDKAYEPLWVTRDHPVFAELVKSGELIVTQPNHWRLGESR
jgi:hypothetical protein